MCGVETDDRAHDLQLLGVAVEEVARRRQYGVDRFEELAVRDLTAEVTPPHLDRIESGTVAGQTQ